MDVKGAKKPSIIISEIKLLKEIHDGGFLLVEGDDDSKFWKHHIDKKCNIRIAGNKTSVLGAAELLDEINDYLTLGIVDADFDRVLGVELSSKRVVFTDYHDIEMTLVKSRAFDRVLIEIIEEHNIFPLDKAIEFSLIFGKLRYIHKYYECKHEFYFSPHKYIKGNSFNESDLFSEFCDKMEIKKQEIEKMLGTILNEPATQLIQGHDLLTILFIIMRDMGCDKSIREGGHLAQRLRLAFHHNDLFDTKMYKTLKMLDSEWNLNMLSAGA